MKRSKALLWTKQLFKKLRHNDKYISLTLSSSRSFEHRLDSFSIKWINCLKINCFIELHLYSEWSWRQLAKLRNSCIFFLNISCITFLYFIYITVQIWHKLKIIFKTIMPKIINCKYWFDTKTNFAFSTFYLKLELQFSTTISTTNLTQQT